MCQVSSVCIVAGDGSTHFNHKRDGNLEQILKNEYRIMNIPPKAD